MAEGRYAEAKQLLTDAGVLFGAAEAKLKRRLLDVATADLRFSSEAAWGAWSADPELKVCFPAWALGPLMTARTHTGYLEFEYFDGEPDKRFAFVYSRTERQPKELFATVAKFRTDGTGTWRRVRVELAPENVLYDMTPGFTFLFKGPVKVRDISFHYTLIK